MTTKVRTLLLSGAVAAISAASAALPATAQTKINVAHVFANDFLPMFMAKENGCFAKRNLDVTLTLIPIINNIPATIIAGSTQIGVTTPTVMLQAVENGLDLVAVAGSSRMMAEQSDAERRHASGCQGRLPFKISRASASPRPASTAWPKSCCESG